MSRIMKRFVDAASRKRKLDEPEVDRIPGTTKIKTYVANSSLYSKEGTIENIVKAVKFCSNDSDEK